MMTPPDLLDLLRIRRADFLVTPASLSHALREGLRVQTLNLHQLYLALTDESFAIYLQTADRYTMDGWPVQRLLAASRDARLTGSGFTRDLTTTPACAIYPFRRIALVGASAKAARGFDSLLCQQGRELVSHDDGDWRSWDLGAIGKKLTDREAELVLVAVSSPAGEAVATEIAKHVMRAGVINVGGAVDMAVGIVRPAPRFARSLDLEWMWRLMMEPSRLWRRYGMECLPTYIRLRREAGRGRASSRTNQRDRAPDTLSHSDKGRERPVRRTTPPQR